MTKIVCFQSGVVRRTNHAIERHASKIYTQTMFEQFGEILFEATAYKVTRIEKGKKYLMTHVMLRSGRDGAGCCMKWQLEKELLYLIANVVSSSTQGCFVVMSLGSWTFFERPKTIFIN